MIQSKNIVAGFCGLCIALSFCGCNVSPPGGAPIQPVTLGNVVDDINRMQEENAEFAKLIIYMHEFEINEQPQPPGVNSNKKTESQFEFEPPSRVHGIRLTPDGQDHVRQIARYLLSGNVAPQNWIVVERSDTSKQWNTKHEYPVHYNDELDNIRRQIVVNSLAAFGIQDADQLVVVAPAYPTGLNAREAANAYQRTFGSNFGNGRGSFGNSFRR